MSISLTTLLAAQLAPFSEAELTLLNGIEIDGLTLDSREVIQGSLFVALNGSVTDGRQFIQSAFAQGASAVLCEVDNNQPSYVEATPLGVIIYLSEVTVQLSHIAAIFYQQPAKQVTIIGITGTNGKTTVTQLLAQWLELLGSKAYSMGTLGNGLVGQLVPSPNTTLNPIAVQQHLALAVSLGADYVVMEVSSHGLSLHRVASIVFDVAVFTNLSRDHLDFHGDMASYGRAKQVLFSQDYCKKAVVNGADAEAQQWLNDWDKQVAVSCFNQRHPDHPMYLEARDINYHTDGISALIESKNGSGRLNSQLLGAFNLENILAALNTLMILGFELDSLLTIAPVIKPVAGRMEAFTASGKPTVVVDYAHTSDALAQALKALRVHCDKQLIVMFGCGGDRDQGKRPLMAEAAETYSDKIIFTQDNSRSEDPNAIISQMFDGIKHPNEVLVELDRTRAVAIAINQATVGDIVLLAGKGHEDYQIIANERLDYDERSWAKIVLKKYHQGAL
ncbi:MAG: UDP-N-acetylmuramoyl-L-alanyl-D-glutamate--2,6-diaminopimelate ligase [Gammaproteobacteria bacterium]|nr:UDP-N-acetylmuramoyl-L-alanyl-D-glutamate--2,6-diaminopimelate ligase [Gammaproteobacteria bacterium]